MPSPSNTARTCLALGRHRKTSSLSAATSATEPATPAPSPESRASGGAACSNASTRAPLFFTRLRQIGSPLTPRPKKPIALYPDICRPPFDERTRWGEVQGERADLVAGARIDLADDRIVPGDDAVNMSGETLHGIPAF